MPIITFDDFAGGLDVRKSAALSNANVLRVLRNAYVTTGKSIKKRPCLEYVATLEAGTIGLKAFGGKLNTFYGDGAAITHANTLFVPRRVPHHTSGVAPTKIHFCEGFNAQMYVAAEYAGSVFRHHYLDDPGVWVTATAYTVGTYRRPTTANGFRYEVTAIAGTGTSGGVEPIWPTTIGSTVIDNAGANQITWTCRTFAVTDVNCPHTKQVAKQAEKIWAAGSTDVSTVRFCATASARDWTAASDAGFLAPGLYASDSDTVTAVAPFQKSGLAIFFADSSQVWAVDPDPSLHELTDNISGVGTLFHRSPGAVSRDLFFLAQNGFRSLSLISLTDNLQDNDVGSAVDDLVTASVASTDDPLSIYYQKLGQLWSINGDSVWSYSFSRTSKISAWSEFTLPIAVDDADVLNQELYIRSGNDVYKVNPAVFKDGTSNIPLVDIQMFHQDGKKPGVLKQFYGIDVIGVGRPTISFKYYDEAGVEGETAGYEYPAMSESGALHPVELCAPRIAPHVQHQKDEAFEISSVMLHFNDLANV